MKKTYGLIVFSLVCAILCAQDPLVKSWDKDFGGLQDENLYSIIQTKDGGYLLGGYVGSDSGYSVSQRPPDTNSVDYWIVKTDAFGNKQWDKRFGWNQGSVLSSFIQTSDGGYLLAGTTNADSGGDISLPPINPFGAGQDEDIWLVKVDSAGNKQWDKRHGGAGNDQVGGVVQTPDGGYLITGATGSWNNYGDVSDTAIGYLDAWILRTDALGNKLWDKRYGGTRYNWANETYMTDDGGFIIIGGTSSDSCKAISEPSRDTIATAFDGWLVRIDSLGNKLWDRRFGGIGSDYLTSIKKTSDQGFILGGYTYSDNTGDVSQPSRGGADYWMIKTDSLGHKLWDKRFGGNLDETSAGYILQTADGGYLISGDSQSDRSGDKSANNWGTFEGWIVKTDAHGNKQWDKTINIKTTNCNLGNTYAIQTNDKEGCYVAATYIHADSGGFKSTLNFGGNDFWFVKFCDSARSETSLSDINPASGVRVFPNPSSYIITIKLDNATLPSRYFVYDLVGNKVAEGVIEENTSTLHVNQFAKGMYLLQIGHVTDRLMWKIVVE